MEQSKKRKYMFIAGPLVLFITLFGLTYAFFNYTRTGQVNNLGTGQIYFNTTEGPTLNLTNLFPMTATEAGEANLDSVSVVIEGNTTYADGEEYEITLVDVNNTVNGKKIPLNYTATYTPNTDKVIGSASNDYWNAREDKDANIYLLNSTGEVKEGEQVLVGYVDNGATGIEGTLTIKAYIDADRIAISDTYYGNATATPTPTAPNDMYGTTTEWVDDRVVLTTEEWNSLNSTPISFKIKAESNEGIWTIKPGSISSCPGCKFILPYDDIANGMYTTWNNQNQTPTVFTTGLYDDYRDLGMDYFIGVKLNNNNEATNAYACGIKNNVPFCIEGKFAPDVYSTINMASFEANVAFLQGANLYNNTCTITTVGDDQNQFQMLECGPFNNTNILSVGATSSGAVNVGFDQRTRCVVSYSGVFSCEAK